VRQITELDVADHLVHTELLVFLELRVALIGIADDDHVHIVEDLRVEFAGGVLREHREEAILLLLREVRELPLERELREVLVPPPHRVPDAVAFATFERVRTVNEGVRAHLVRPHLGERLRAVLLPAPVVGDVLRHLRQRLHDRERQ
jgi:hypothetical protein